MAALHPWQRLQADPALLDDFAPLWRLVEAVRECDGDEDEVIAALAPSHADCQVIWFQLGSVCDALRRTIERRTRVGREAFAGTGSFFGGRSVSLGSDDGFTDFLSYLVSLGADACKRILSDPKGAMPPRDWTHFEELFADHWWPRQREGFVVYALTEYFEKAYPGAPELYALQAHSEPAGP